jgi:hypothetical protein
MLNSFDNTEHKYNYCTAPEGDVPTTGNGGWIGS